EMDADRAENPIVPPVQHRVRAPDYDLVQVRHSGARPDAPPRLGAGEQLHVGRARRLRESRPRERGRGGGGARACRRGVSTDRGGGGGTGRGGPRAARCVGRPEEGVPQYRRDQEHHAGGDQGGNATLDHVRNMRERGSAPLALLRRHLYHCGLLMLGQEVFALPAPPLIRWRVLVIAAWAALALLFAPRASHVQQVLALRGGASERTESARATELLKQAFPSPFADYVAIVVRGPVRWTNRRFEVVLDTLKVAAERRPYVNQVISVRDRKSTR